MNKINDMVLLHNYMEKYKIKDCFDTSGLHFELVQYQKGNMVIRPEEPLNSIIFVVEGYVKIYAIQQDGTQNAINMTSGFIILGETEFLTASAPRYFAEAVSDLICIEVPLHRHKEELFHDIRFMQLLAKGLAQKFQMIIQQEAISMDLEEKVQNYIKYYCYNQTIEHIEQTAFQLHCSRRQLQRVLKKMTDDGVLKKIGKGKYLLADSTIW